MRLCQCQSARFQVSMQCLIESVTLCLCMGRSVSQCLSVTVCESLSLSLSQFWLWFWLWFWFRFGSLNCSLKFEEVRLNWLHNCRLKSVIESSNHRNIHRQYSHTVTQSQSQWHSQPSPAKTHFRQAFDIDCLLAPIQRADMKLSCLPRSSTWGGPLQSCAP